jgi:hypothetical protein
LPGRQAHAVAAREQAERIGGSADCILRRERDAIIRPSRRLTIAAAMTVGRLRPGRARHSHHRASLASHQAEWLSGYCG